MAGTVMQDSHTPMSTWFWGAYLLTSLTPGMSAVQFQRQLGLTRYETAFQILHKLRAGMVRPGRDRIGGALPVEVDETYVGGKTRGEGKGVHHGIIVAGAVEVRNRQAKVLNVSPQSKAVPRRGGRYAGRLRLSVVPNRSAKSLCRFVEDSVESGTFVVTDAWQGFASLQERGFDHLPVAERDEARIAEEYLPMIHLVFSNLKTWINGVHHGVDPQHLQAYCNEFTFRFNRRFYPFNSFRSLLGIAADSEVHTYAGLYSGHPEHVGEIRESARVPRCGVADYRPQSEVVDARVRRGPAGLAHTRCAHHIRCDAQGRESHALGVWHLAAARMGVGHVHRETLCSLPTSARGGLQGVSRERDELRTEVRRQRERALFRLQRYRSGAQKCMNRISMQGRFAHVHGACAGSGDRDPALRACEGRPS